MLTLVISSPVSVLQVLGNSSRIVPYFVMSSQPAITHGSYAEAAEDEC
jgi:hypothetical protein